MLKQTGVWALACVAGLAGQSILAAQPASSNANSNVIAAAAQAMGADKLNTLQFVGEGANYAFGQSYSPDAPWPKFAMPNYAADIDYRTSAMRVTMDRAGDPDTPVPEGVVRSPGMWRGGGGAPPFIGTQRQVQVVSGNIAWNGDGAAGAPAFQAASGRLLDLWMTPHGVLKAAADPANNPTVATEGGRTVVRFTAAGSTVTATLNADRLVERVSTLSDNPLFGDVVTETVYSGYRQYGDIRFPTRIVRTQGAYPVLEINVTAVRPNATVAFAVPEKVRAAPVPSGPPPAPKLEAVRLGEGVYRITGGSHQSVAVEFNDHIVVIEGGQGDNLSIPSIDLIKRTIPNKPIRYVVNTHHHHDHSGGLRAYVAEGATVVTHAINRPYYERVWAGPRTVRPDRLSQSPRPATFETLTDRKVMTDGKRVLELHHLEGIWHNAGLIVAYLPQEKLLVEPDVYEAGFPPINGGENAFNADYANLLNNIERLKLDVDRIAPLHAGMSSLSDLKAAVARGQAAR